MFACFSAKAAQNVVRAPAKPPKPGGSKSTLPAQPQMVVSADAPPPAAPPKPRALQGRDTLERPKKGDYRREDGTVVAMIGPTKGPTCITVPSAKEETSKDGSEKYYVYTVSVKLLGGKTHTCKFRFSEIAVFHKEWQSMYPGVEIELPKKQIGGVTGVSDEDIARRCVEIQGYLREMCDVTALIYVVAKFFGLEEAELKAAVKGREATDTPVAQVHTTPTLGKASSGKSNRALPKVKLDDAEDQRRISMDKPKLPKVKLGDIENNSSRQEAFLSPTPPPVSEEPPPTPPPKQRITEIKEQPPPAAATPPPSTPKELPSTPKEKESPVPSVQKKETPPEVKSAPSSVTTTPKKEPTNSSPWTAKPSALPTTSNSWKPNNSQAKENTAAKNNTPSSPYIPPSRKDPQPVKTEVKKPEPIKGADSSQKTIPAVSAPNGEKAMSVKDRMAAFQKKG